MAQAARLNLRMQKEIQILVTDPPHGVSLPQLSNADSSSDAISLSSIDARLQGPEGTVYEKGVFDVKIRIPERYPFQPPIVTFETPVYHPNIDNGGRICLDILNLPPKGAWQPSLNISTVLTSIGLLLCEPNPDDGLMCEASKEYKYNRRAFDQKARSFTEKYAMPGSGSTSNVGPVSRQNVIEAEQGEPRLQCVLVTDGNGKRLRGLSSKLSLDCSVPLESNNANVENFSPTGNQENAAPIGRLSLSKLERLSGGSAKALTLCVTGNHEEPKPAEDQNRRGVNSYPKQAEHPKQAEQALGIPEPIIISDSEESEEEEKIRKRSRFAILRKNTAGR